MLTMMLWLWFVHVFFGFLSSSFALVLGTGRVRWRLQDLSAFILPFGVWLALFCAFPTGKSLANLAEPIYFSPAIGAAALIRVLAGDRIGPRALSAALVGLLCLVAVGVFRLTPCLPE